jgi:transposase
MPERYVDIDRRSPMLLPVALREWVAKDALARLIIDAIEQWDLRRVVANDSRQRQPAVSPGMMVSLLIYAYAQGVFSSRRIEQLTYENLSVRYLCGNTHPDHDTSAKFRRENAGLFPRLYAGHYPLGPGVGNGQTGDAGGRRDPRSWFISTSIHIALSQRKRLISGEGFWILGKTSRKRGKDIGVDLPWLLYVYLPEKFF